MKPAPKTWVMASIGRLCSLKNGRAFKPTEWSVTGLPIVRIQNLNNPQAAFNRFSGSFDSRHYLAGGELLFAWSGTPGTSFGAHLWKGGEALLNQHIFRVDFDERQIDKRFFRFAINQKLGELIDVAHGGAGLQHVTKGVFENTEIAMPGRGEQQRIADKLDTVLARVDACRDRLARVAPLLKRFRQSVLAAATSGRLTDDWRHSQSHAETGEDLLASLQDDHARVGGHARGNASEPTEEAHDLDNTYLPSAWSIVKLLDVCEPGRPITYGILKPGPELDEGVPYVRVADFPGNRLRLESIKKTSFEIDEQFKRARLRSGDLLLSIRGSVGRVVEIPEVLANANITQDTARLSVSSRMNRRYVLLTLLEEGTQRRMRAATRGVAVRGINIGDVRALQLPLPPPAEQTEIVRRVEILFAFADRLEARLAKAQTAVDRLTPSLLAKAFRGELVPQDPNDEPAAELLKRLAAQRDAAPPRTRRSRVTLSEGDVTP